MYRLEDFLQEKTGKTDAEVSVLAFVTRRLVNGAVRKSKEKAGGRCWVCGTYTDAVKKGYALELSVRFTQQELEHIAAVLRRQPPDKTLELDPGDDEVLIKLKKSIPVVSVNRYGSDIFRENEKN